MLVSAGMTVLCCACGRLPLIVVWPYPLSMSESQTMIVFTITAYLSGLANNAHAIERE